MSDNPIGDLAGALAKAQADMQNASFNKTNPHFKSKYADLAAIRDTVTPALAKHGIAVTQTISVIDGAAYLVTKLIHAGGGEISGSWPLPGNHADPQKFMSATTYARRGSLAAICNIASEEDDDGNAASAKPAQSAPSVPPPRPEDGGARELTAEEKAIKWAQDQLAKLRTLKAVEEFDAWEAKSLPTIDKLHDTHRDTWVLLKKRMTETRTKLAPAKEAA